MKKLIKNVLWNIKHRHFRYNKTFLALSELIKFDERENFLEMVMDYARSSRLSGDYLEFGVFQGHTFISSFHFANSQGKNLSNMRFFAFDSFQGLPKPEGVDIETFDHFKEGDYSFSLDNFVKNLKRSNVDMKRVIITPGWFNKTLNSKLKDKFILKKASIVYIDCDLYSSTVDVLNFVEDLIYPGTLIAFDDWFTFRGSPDQGEQLAFKVWLKKHPKIKVEEFRKFGWHGNSFIVVKTK